MQFTVNQERACVCLMSCCFRIINRYHRIVDDQIEKRKKQKKKRMGEDRKEENKTVDCSYLIAPNGHFVCGKQRRLLYHRREDGIARRIRKVAERKSGVIRLVVTFDCSIIPGRDWSSFCAACKLFAVAGSGSRPINRRTNVSLECNAAVWLEHGDVGCGKIARKIE